MERVRDHGRPASALRRGTSWAAARSQQKAGAGSRQCFFPLRFEEHQMTILLSRRTPRLAAALAVAASLAWLATGCSHSSPSTADGTTKLKVAYLGLTCEAPIFIAQEKGF